MFYVFHGDDDYSQRETLAGLTAKLGDPGLLSLNTSRFEGGRLTLPALRHASDAVPFLAPARLVLVEAFFTRNPARALVDELLEYLPHVPETTRLVFLEPERLPANHPALKVVAATSNGYAKEFGAPQGRQLEGWVRDRVAAGGGTITPRAVQLLAASVGGDLRVMAGEVEKLLLYQGTAPIDVPEVEKLCPYAAEASIFDLVDALGGRRGPEATLLFQRKLAEGADPFYLFSMVVRQFRLLIQTRALADEGARAAEIGRALRLPAFVVNKILGQSSQFTPDQLRQIYAHLLDLDVGAKTGQIDMETGLHLFLAGIT